MTLLSIHKRLKTMTLILLITCLCLPALAAFVQPGKASDIAGSWLNFWSNSTDKTAVLTSVRAFSGDMLVPAESNYPSDRIDLPTFYLINYQGGAYAIVAADDSSIPILAYSTESAIDPNDLPPAVKMWMNYYHDEVLQIRNNKTEIPENLLRWTEISSGDYSRYENSRDVSPLVAAKWNQNWPYNELCPLDPAGPGGRVYAGCVATAMGMVMKYWNSPVTGQGSNTYYAGSYGYQSANFGNTTYLWDQMPNSVTSSNIPVATLLYHLGVAVNMNYAPDGSGSNGSLASSAMRNNFRYPNAVLSQKSNYSASGWENLMRAQIDNGSPMYYSGSDTQMGHAFVLDGYQGTNYFHFNFGWSGSYDGYYYVNSLTPGSNNFNYNQAAITNSIPANYTIANPRIQLFPSQSMVGDPMQISLTTYPVLTSWNVTTYSMSFFYDQTNIDFLGYTLDDTISNGGSVTIDTSEQDFLHISWSRTAPLFGGGNLIKLNFRANEPGEYYFDILNAMYNSTALANTEHLIMPIVAPVESLPESSISLTNAMQIGYQQIATMELRTSHLLPSWNVNSAQFNVSYNPERLEFYGIATDGTLTNGLIPEWSLVTPGNALVTVSSPVPIVGSSALLKLQFRAIGNTASSTVNHIVPSNFFYNDTAITTIGNGYVVLSPYTSNDDQVALPVVSLSAYPNPFNPLTNIAFSVVNSSPAIIDVFNVKGQRVKRLTNQSYPTGNHNISWNGTDDKDRSMSSGIYFVRLHHDSKTKTIKLLMVK